MIFNIILWLAIIWLIFRYYSLPKKDDMYNVKVSSTYFIQAPNKTEVQKNVECAAFSSAYVLRHFGIESEGNELYRTYPRKLLDGTFYPKAIIVFFKKLGYPAMYLRGNMNTLRKQISRGVPVILFIRVHADRRFLHFVPVVGYDETHFYLAESLDFKRNCDEAQYNRKISIDELESLWNTWLPFSHHSYIVIEPQPDSLDKSA
ncbi:C39 family peptidase [Paenibacillus sp. 2TAF8]|uniref:C39 family peptidase n=1 Tax=Paenibacillus sp. 2TAF8 TaxID=3233020 RepID=UPI003F955C09